MKKLAVIFLMTLLTLGTVSSVAFAGDPCPNCSHTDWKYYDDVIPKAMDCGVHPHCVAVYDAVYYYRSCNPCGIQQYLGYEALNFVHFDQGCDWVFQNSIPVYCAVCDAEVGYTNMYICSWFFNDPACNNGKRDPKQTFSWWHEPWCPYYE